MAGTRPGHDARQRQLVLPTWPSECLPEKRRKSTRPRRPAAKNLDGSDWGVLVIVTTIMLDPSNDRYNEKLVERLSRAANEYLARSSEAAAFVLVNRMRQWPR
jgi:hypothetical protein